MCCWFDEHHRKRGSIFHFQTHGTFIFFQEPTLPTWYHDLIFFSCKSQLFKGPTLIRDWFYKILVFEQQEYWLSILQKCNSVIKTSRWRQPKLRSALNKRIFVLLQISSLGKANFLPHHPSFQKKNFKKPKDDKHPLDWK